MPVPTQNPSTDDKVHEYFEVSPAKLAVMSIFTIGIYDIYWMYKQWSAIKREEGTDILPFWRAIFGVLFLYSLFKKMKTENAAALAICTILLWWSARLPGKIWLISLLAFMPLVFAQQQANALHHSDIPASYSKKEIAFACIGGIVLVLALIGAFAPTR